MNNINQLIRFSGKRFRDNAENVEHILMVQFMPLIL